MASSMQFQTITHLANVEHILTDNSQMVDTHSLLLGFTQYIVCQLQCQKSVQHIIHQVQLVTQYIFLGFSLFSESPTMLTKEETSL